MTSNGVLNIEFSILKKQKLTAEMTDEQGRIVRSLFQNREMPVGVFQQKFELKNLPQGVFFLEIKNEKGEGRVIKVIRGH